MHEHPCVEVRELLEAYYDGELPIERRVAVQNHLDDCVACSLTASELSMLGSTLRDFALHVAEGDTTDPSRLSSQVLERLRVEEQFSMRAQLTDWFQDMHLVWAGLGASVATLVCIVGSASVLHATSQERPNSMARTIAVLASPGSNDNPLRLSYDMSAPRAVTDVAIELSEEDAQYTFSAVVSREGRVQGVEMINQHNRPGVNAMLNEVYRMKFAPATDRGDAVAVSMLWLVASTTVKGRHDETMQALRQALRLRTTPEPISALPVPAEAAEPKPQAAPLVKPVVPEPPSPSSTLALAAASL
ncbi:MAG TPA: zf-HC2 domain-containing protein [Vicinamibacterales bacterium]|nr:zf-HC2 domain-containing protein [Vicinamibacterales bacterium]